MSNPVFAFVEKHPMTTGVAVFGVGLLVLLMMGGQQGGGGNSGQGQAASAYYAAESADAQAGDAVQVAQINANASTTQALGSDAASVQNNSTWASTDLSETTVNDQTQSSLAPYAVESQAVSALTTAVQAPPITTTSSSPGVGILGLHFGGGTTTTVTPNPVAVSASEELSSLINGFNAGA